ncbi:beta-lactamase/transpeptidase-like protein [Echria macrotheca]|uniref:Beta-lactamase/transpeptidase-like protein n=1 Tax=Echria macrotheca TaxID=438768 RepID=A0AAJ0BET0_9PEZI|nr:beta-lactamase/transpeptidase-like protein [Echria macrotheca]
MSFSPRITSLLAVGSFLTFFLACQAADQPVYQPCPLIRAYYPAPTIDKSSDLIKSFSQNFSAVFDNLIKTGNHEIYGEITPNTTSFSVVLFSTADDGHDDPIFFDYHHTAPAAKAKKNVGLDTVFPIGSLTQLFTVYAWLAKFGDKEWDTPITKFIPELLNAKGPTSKDDVKNEFTVPWSDVTIGALASHMAGVARDSNACQLGKACDKKHFVDTFAQVPPVSLPDMTPIFSNAGFQLLALAVETPNGPGPKGATSYDEVLRKTILGPLNMTHTRLAGDKGVDSSTIFGGGLNTSAPGEQGSLSILSTTSDLARLGHSILSSSLLPPATTRRWFTPAASTSNLRNSVGRPWEIYHASFSSASPSPIADIFLKSGEVASYSSYLGLSPDLSVGFAILAHDSSLGNKPADLNVYADVVAETLADIFGLAARGAMARFGGSFSGVANNMNTSVEFEISADGPGLVVSNMVIDGKDVRAEMANQAGIETKNLDFRVYPAIEAAGKYQFVAVYQDKNAPVDAGTPTCITWMTVGQLGGGAVDRVVFELDKDGVATGVSIPSRGITMTMDKKA